MCARLIGGWFASILAFAGVQFLRGYGPWRAGWLSTEAEARLARSHRGGSASIAAQASGPTDYDPLYAFLRPADVYARDRLEDDLKHWYQPSLVGSVAIVIVGGLVVGALMLVLCLTGGTWGGFSRAAGALWALLAIVAGLAIFIAESMRDAPDLVVKHVLLRRSRLWPVALVAVLAVVLSGAGVGAYARTSLLVAVGLLIVHSFWRALGIVLDDGLLDTERRQLFAERVRLSIRQSLRDRIGNSALLRELEGGSLKAADYSPWASASAGDGYAGVTMDAKGHVRDIHVGELARLVAYVEHEAHTRGLGAAGDLEPRNADAKSSRVLKLLGDAVSGEGDGDAFLSVPAGLLDDEPVATRLRRWLPRVVHVSAGRLPAAQLRRYMAGTRNRLMKACQDEALGDVEALTDIYVEFADEFLAELGRVGAVYPTKEAAQARTSVFSRWEELDFVTRDLYKALEVAIASGSASIARRVAEVPFSIAWRAVKIGDHLLFQEFLRFTNEIVALCAKSPQSEQAQALAQAQLRGLQALADHADEVDADTYTDFARELLQVYQELAKAAYDRRDFPLFTACVEGLARLFRRLTQPAAGIHSESRARERLSEVLGARAQVWLGLGAWVWDECLAGQEVDDYCDALRERLPQNLPELTALWLAAEDDRVEDQWGWGRWEMKDTDEVQRIDFGRKLRQLYVAQALEILAVTPPEDAPRVPVTPSRELSARLGIDRPGSLQHIMQAVETGDDQWRGVLSDGAVEAIARLREILERAEAEQNEIEASSLRSTPLVQEKVDSFIQSFLEGVVRSGTVRALLERHGASEGGDAADPGSEDEGWWGVESIIAKHAFVDVEDLVFGDRGGQTGHDLAVQENASLLAEIVKAAGAAEVASTADIPQAIADHVDGSDWQRPVLIMTFDPDDHGHAFWASDIAVRRWQVDADDNEYSDLDSYQGHLRCGDSRVHVFQVFVPHSSETRGTFLLASLGSLGELRQYTPLKPGDSEHNRHGRFFIRVQDLNADDAERARRLDGRARFPADVAAADKENLLRERALVTIRQRMTYVTRAAAAGVQFVVTEPTES